MCWADSLVTGGQEKQSWAMKPTFKILTSISEGGRKALGPGLLRDHADSRRRGKLVFHSGNATLRVSFEICVCLTVGPLTAGRRVPLRSQPGPCRKALQGPLRLHPHTHSGHTWVDPRAQGGGVPVARLTPHLPCRDPELHWHREGRAHCGRDRLPAGPAHPGLRLPRGDPALWLHCVQHP